ncbi:MAG: hypothetical protein PQ612_03560 [Rickettsiales bacterium]|nr:hypothetical protein [Pseudomonadota bacterium]MDA0965811.1 hypothetical protein [Pseudomonadota bacterium]MDG4542719.1 hypothetical protein [Rickettsiales bacterium]MDG4545223.1 hypothetical protein [Rickettsiales bacterium]MDG4547347.1 hypothetical protein [Rickettsiales bacterium]
MAKNGWGLGAAHIPVWYSRYGLSVNNRIMSGRYIGQAHDTYGSYSVSRNNYYVTTIIESSSRVYSYMNGDRTYYDDFVTVAQHNKILGPGQLGSLDSGSYWNGTMGEIILFDYPLSDSERDTLHTYLSNKWNIPITP